MIFKIIDMKNVKISSLPLIVLALLLTSSGSRAAGFAAFLRPTDTIRVSGQTVVDTNLTIEAIVMLPSYRHRGGIVFNEWTDGQEDKLLTIRSNRLSGNAFPS